MQTNHTPPDHLEQLAMKKVDATGKAAAPLAGTPDGTRIQDFGNDPNDRPLSMQATDGNAGTGRALERISIITIAAICHAANAELCRQYGDNSQPAWEDAPSWQQSSAVNGVRKIHSGEVTEPGQSHISWSEEKRGLGWVYGSVKNPDATPPTHPCLVPFEELPLEQQAKDHLFFAIASALLLV